jgi:hypothetical protein
MQMKLYAANAAQAKSLVTRTGDHCPETGWWQPYQSETPGSTTPSRFLAQGSIMPALDGLPTLWVPRHTAHRQTDY